MSANIIDGKEVARKLRERISSAVKKIEQEYNKIPGVAVVLVGNDPASEVYVRNKGIQTKEVGMTSYEFKLPEDTPEKELLEKVEELNNDPNINGILVQFPVPQQISQQKVIETIHPAKDVDGLHPINSGYLSSGLDGLVPCTPQGATILIKEACKDLTGKKAVIIGRSNLVGKPVGQLLLKEHCTVTICHSRSQNLELISSEADILVAAVGIPNLVKKDWVKRGAVVIDVGINRVDIEENGESKTRLVGDVDFEDVKEIAGSITPVPGGVGPMTIACLLLNTLNAFCDQNNFDRPNI